MLDNYRAVELVYDIERIVLLSSMGAQHPEGTGNLLALYMLEQTLRSICAAVWIEAMYE